MTAPEQKVEPPLSGGSCPECEAPAPSDELQYDPDEVRFHANAAGLADPARTLADTSGHADMSADVRTPAPADAGGEIERAIRQYLREYWRGDMNDRIDLMAEFVAARLNESNPGNTNGDMQRLVESLIVAAERGDGAEVRSLRSSVLAAHERALRSRPALTPPAGVEALVEALIDAVSDQAFASANFNATNARRAITADAANAARTALVGALRALAAQAREAEGHAANAQEAKDHYDRMRLRAQSAELIIEEIFSVLAPPVEQERRGGGPLHCARLVVARLDAAEREAEGLRAERLTLRAKIDEMHDMLRRSLDHYVDQRCRTDELEARVAELVEDKDLLDYAGQHLILWRAKLTSDSPITVDAREGQVPEGEGLRAMIRKARDEHRPGLAGHCHFNTRPAETGGGDA